MQGTRENQNNEITDEEYNSLVGFLIYNQSRRCRRVSSPKTRNSLVPPTALFVSCVDCASTFYYKPFFRVNEVNEGGLSC